jgi:GNAT superfamily N-acetyltransferase
MNWKPRLANEKDVSALEELIPLSVRALQASYYTPAQIEAAIGPVFCVDRRLIGDGTYFVVEEGDKITGCGGWSRRKKLFGSDRELNDDAQMLDPVHDSARIRAFFIHPAWARRGIGRSILMACEDAAMKASFQKAELVATLAGEPLYASCGYAVAERYEAPMSGNLNLPVVRMTKYFKVAQEL